MAKQLFLLSATLLLLAAPWPAGSAKAPPPNSLSSPAPSPVDCDSVVINMMSCLDYVQEGSKKAEPDSDCCDGLEEVVRLSPTCLCEGLKTASELGYAINMTRAAELPRSCNVKVPGIGNCGVSSTPSPAPTPSPTPSPSPAAPQPSPSSPAPPVSPPVSPPPHSHEPAPPVSPPVSPPPHSEPAPPVSPPQPSPPSHVPQTPPVASPSEAQAPLPSSTSASASSEPPSSLGFLAGIFVASLAYLVV